MQELIYGRQVYHLKVLQQPPLTLSRIIRQVSVLNPIPVEV